MIRNIGTENYYDRIHKFIEGAFIYDKTKECNYYHIFINPLTKSGLLDDIKIKDFSIGHNINNNDIFIKKTDSEIIKYSFKDWVNENILDMGFSSFESFIKFLNKYEIPISKEEFYRIDYSDEEISEICEYTSNLSKNLPEIPEID